MSRPFVEMPPEAEPFLGVSTDTGIAQFFSVDRRHVARWRRERGITAAPPGRLQLPAEVRSRLGVEPDSDIAKSLGLHPSTPVIRRWRDEFGIPPGTRGGKGKARKTRSERDADLEGAYPGLLPKLGQFSDRELAREFGLSPSAVRKARSSRNIPTARKL
jgi:AraC-like DNA-binding protein